MPKILVGQLPNLPYTGSAVPEEGNHTKGKKAS